MRNSKNHQSFLFGYLTGLIVTATILLTFLLLFFHIEIKEDPKNLLSELMLRWGGRDQAASFRENTLLRTPSAAIIKELTEKGANFDNTKKLVQREIGLHSSIAVEPDQLLRYRLRKNVRLKAYFLKSHRELNFDPPLIYLDRTLSYSEDLKSYLKENALSSYEITSDSSGFRLTLPQVHSDRKILVIGDSVAFGLGVGDNDTFSSHLQRRVKENYQVLNGALSGYGLEQAYSMMEKYKDKNIEHLIFVLCENDLKSDGFSSRKEEIASIIRHMGTYQPYYKKITLVLHQYIYDTISPLFEPHKQDEIHHEMKQITEGFKPLARELNIDFLNWYDLVQDDQRKKGSLFSPFALYVDHCHFSSEGNLLLAKAIDVDRN